MKTRTDYVEAPEGMSAAIANGEVVSDFLPPPDRLVRRRSKVKITITLNEQSIEFFKRSAKENNVKYQTMINEVLDLYVKHYSETL